MSGPAHEQRAHSMLGASSAHRWGACPGSIRLSTGVENVTSEFAALGTAAHEVCEMALRGGQDAIEYVGRIIKTNGYEFEVDEDMANAVQVFLDAVRAILRPDDVLMIEQRFDLSNSIMPGMFGTCDVVIYRPSTGQIWVIDYKHGQGYAVEVEGNVQLLYYGVGGASTVAGEVNEVNLVIVQPRSPHKNGPVRTWSTDFFGLLEYATNLRFLAERTMDPDAPLKSGDHCKFCPAAGFCPQLRSDAMTAAALDFDDPAPSPAELTPDELGAILQDADLVEAWLKAVRAHAKRILDAGGEVTGFKLVEKRATRKWADIDLGEIATALELLGAEPDDIYTRKLITPAQAEKLIPKNARAELAAYVTKESTGTTMASTDDPRPAVTVKTAADEFAD